MTLYDEAERGRKYADAYDHLLEELFADLRSMLIEKFEDCPVQDTKGLTEIKYLLHNLKALDGMVKRVIEDGHLASVQLEQEAEREKRAEVRGKIRRFA